MSKKIRITKVNYQKEDGMLIPEYTSTYFTSLGYKVYENVFHKQVKLNSCSLKLFHFLCEQMKNDNTIHHTKGERNRFIHYCKKNASITYSHDTIKASYSQLKKVGLLINFDSKCDFIVNPKHIFKGSEKDRQKLINKIILSLSGRDTKSNYYRALGLDARDRSNS